MINYDLILQKQKLLGADRFTLAANANETMCLHFHFDRHWRVFDSKAAVFRNAENRDFRLAVNSPVYGTDFEVWEYEAGTLTQY